MKAAVRSRKGLGLDQSAIHSDRLTMTATMTQWVCADLFAQEGSNGSNVLGRLTNALDC